MHTPKCTHSHRHTIAEPSPRAPPATKLRPSTKQKIDTISNFDLRNEYLVGATVARNVDRGCDFKLCEMNIEFSHIRNDIVVALHWQRFETTLVLRTHTVSA